MKFNLARLAIIACLLTSCAPTPANYTSSSCASNTVMSLVDAGSSTTGVAAGAALGQHIRLNQEMLVKKIMIRWSSGGVTNMIVSFFENFTSLDQTTFSGPIYNFTWIGNFNNGSLEIYWITLPTPILLKANTEYMIGLAPNSNITLGDSASYGYDSLRTAYRTGTGPYNSWGNASQKSISIGLEGDLDCQ